MFLVSEGSAFAVVQAKRRGGVRMHRDGLRRPSSDGHVLPELLLVGLRGPSRIGLVEGDLSLQMLVHIRLFQRVCHYGISSLLSH